MISLFTVLGVSENASQNTIVETYKRLASEFKLERFQLGTHEYNQAKQCLEAIEHAYEILSDPQLKSSYINEQKNKANSKEGEYTHPRLGQLCVTSGMITIEQLKQALEEQGSTGLLFGEVLQEKQLISQSELEGLLLGQEMIDISSELTNPIVQRLMSLGLISEDMIFIANMQMCTQMKTLKEILIENNWVAPKIFDILFKLGVATE